MSSRARMAIRIKGIVQGVGFRPFIFNLALEHGLTGWVTNDSVGVLLEVEGKSEAVGAFLAAIPEKVPPLARIDLLEHWEMAVQGSQEFVIRATDRSERVQTLISPDMATCPDCLREMRNPDNHRYLYPFINCTNCGPRFTIIQEMPYDRPFTTMHEFVMCPDCQNEYENPRNRRFHAQPNACPDCGPTVWLTDAAGVQVSNRNLAEQQDENAGGGIDDRKIPDWAEPIIALRSLLIVGKIAGVKGLGGYHLVCDASNSEAVLTLRKRKHRPAKPLAVMMPDLVTVRQYCDVTDAEAKLLESPSRPIVLLRWREKAHSGIAVEVAPAQSRLGVMLPYTPLHHLLFSEKLQVLVMTSGNISGEPIIYDDSEAVARLGEVVDYFLIHDRGIVRPCDDSVQRVDQQPIMIRRSRGYAPMPLKLTTMEQRAGQGIPAILACGGELKNVFGLARDGQIFLSQHIGDLKTRNSFQHYRQMIDEMTHLLEIEPEVVAYDLHPSYLSSRYALDKFADRKLVGVQHHHAHIASCMAEYGLEGDVIGLAFDGTGYGTDGKIWGGEALITTATGFERWAHLRYLPLPGGDRAIQEPWRIGAAYLEAVLSDVQWMKGLDFWHQVDMGQWELLRQMIAQGMQTPETSSMGRLFDGVAAILGVRGRISYEGQAAIELEELAGEQIGNPYPFRMYEEVGVMEPLPTGGVNFGQIGAVEKSEILTSVSKERIIDPLPMIEAIAGDLRSGVERREIARRFHGTIVELAFAVCSEMRAERGLTRVVLSGGVLQNRLLSLGMQQRLKAGGFDVYQQRLVPANDGGLALGQAYVAVQTIMQK